MTDDWAMVDAKTPESKYLIMSDEFVDLKDVFCDRISGSTKTSLELLDRVEILGIHSAVGDNC